MSEPCNFLVRRTASLSGSGGEVFQLRCSTHGELIAQEFVEDNHRQARIGVEGLEFAKRFSELALAHSSKFVDYQI